MTLMLLVKLTPFIPLRRLTGLTDLSDSIGTKNVTVKSELNMKTDIVTTRRRDEPCEHFHDTQTLKEPSIIS